MTATAGEGERRPADAVAAPDARDVADAAAGVSGDGATMRRWLLPLAVLAACWGALGVMFARDVGDLARIYWTNTTFGHCLFIAPVVGWLVWQRRHEIAPLPVCGWWPGLIPAAAAAFVWTLGDAAGVALLRHAGLVGMAQAAVIAVLGPRVARGLAFPIAYMAFLVPFGDFLEPPLQRATIAMVMPLLHLAGVPAVADGVLVTTPNGYFEIAEACSGAKFLIAMIAYGVLVAAVCYRRWRRRAAFMAMALVVPVIANGLRAFGTIYAAWWTSVEAATGFDHIVYGWVFFAIVMAAVLAIGWPWFDRDPDARWFDAATTQALRRPVRRLRTGHAVAALALLAVASGAIGWADAMARRVAVLPPVPSLPEPAGWQRVPEPQPAPWSPHFPGADRMLTARYIDRSGRVVDLAIAVYANQREGREIVGFGIGALRENDRWVRVTDLAPVAGGRTIRMVGPGRVERATASWYRVGGMTTGNEGRVKLETLKVKLTGASPAAVAILVSAEQRGAIPAAETVAAFAAAIGPIDALADRFAGGR